MTAEKPRNARGHAPRALQCERRNSRRRRARRPSCTAATADAARRPGTRPSSARRREEQSRQCLCDVVTRRHRRSRRGSRSPRSRSSRIRWGNSWGAGCPARAASGCRSWNRGDRGRVDRRGGGARRQARGPRRGGPRLRGRSPSRTASSPSAFPSPRSPARVTSRCAPDRDATGSPRTPRSPSSLRSPRSPSAAAEAASGVHAPAPPDRISAGAAASGGRARGMHDPHLDPRRPRGDRERQEVADRSAMAAERALERVGR